MHNILNASFLLALASHVNAQAFGPPGGFPGSGSGSGSGNDPYDPFDGGFGSLSARTKIITAHAVLAAVAFGLLFPGGGILIRLASFRRVWLAHAALQLLAYLFFIVAFGCGIWMFISIPRDLPNGVQIQNQAHPYIGMVVFGLLFLQPWLGLIHHFLFKKYSRRTFWSYAHIWIGRIVITLGIINGGLGLQLSERIGDFTPSKGAIIAYSVVAGIVWLIYVLSAFFGERKRKQAQYDAKAAPPPYKNEGRYGNGARYA